jgi:hypothetical protein
MSCYSVAKEIMSICADYLVEQRGFEPMAIEGAVRSAVAKLGLCSFPLDFGRCFSLRASDTDLPVQRANA